MIEKMKLCCKLLTVKIGLAAVAVSFLSLFLPWFTYQDESQSAMEAIFAAPDFFAGVLPALFVAMIWIVAFFLFNHPKLTLLGDFGLLFLYAGFAIAGFDRGLSAGIGGYIYLLAVVVCIVCAILTKKRKKA